MIYEHFGSKENFTCALKLLSDNDRIDDTFIELEPILVIRFMREHLKINTSRATLMNN